MLWSDISNMVFCVLCFGISRRVKTKRTGYWSFCLAKIGVVAVLCKKSGIKPKNDIEFLPVIDLLESPVSSH